MQKPLLTGSTHNKMHRQQILSAACAFIGGAASAFALKEKGAPLGRRFGDGL